MKPNTCAQAGYCIGMSPPCMAECRLNDEQGQHAEHDGDPFEGLFYALFLMLLIVLFGLVLFLAGYFSHEITAAAVKSWGLLNELGYAVKTVNF